MNEFWRYLFAGASFGSVILLMQGLSSAGSDSQSLEQVFKRSKRLRILGQLLSVSEPAAFLVCILAIVVAPAFLMLWRFPVGLLAVALSIVGVVLLPLWGRGMLRRRQRKLFEEQLPGFVDLLVSAVRGNLPLPIAISNVAPLLSEPLRGEIYHFSNEATQGRGGMEAAIANARKRQPSRSYSMLLSVIGVFSAQGGNLVEPIQTMSKSFKEIHRLGKKMESATASSRAAFWMINLALLGIIIMLSVAAPELLDMTFRSVIGAVLFFGGMIIWGLGSFVLYQMTKVEI